MCTASTFFRDLTAAAAYRTQAVRIAEALGVPAVSTGDIFRQNIKEQTEIGQRVTAILDAGEYVPDELTNELVDDRRIADATWASLAERYSTQQLMDLVFTVGQYVLTCMALRSFDVPLDEGLPGYPERAGDPT